MPPVSISSGLALSLTSQNPKVCASTIDGKVLPKSAGECRLVISQPGNLLYEPAAEISLVGYVVNDGFSITCTKGKTVRKVTGAKPKCPLGFTKK
jgi:hypothetical protein